MKTKFNNKMPENGKAAPSADALVEKAKTGKLTDNELDQVSGGILTKTTITTDLRRQTAVIGLWSCPYCSCSCDSSEGLEHHIQRDHPEKVQ